MKKGFTLIELLVVVLIIGILAAAAVPQYQKAVLRTRYSEAVLLVSSVVLAQERHYMANGSYADSFEALDIGLQGTAQEDGKRIRIKDGLFIKLEEAVAAADLEKERMAYHQYYTQTPHSSGARFCIVNKTAVSEEMKKRLCQSLGAVYDAETASYTSYRFK